MVIFLKNGQTLLNSPSTKRLLAGYKFQLPKFP